MLDRCEVGDGRDELETLDDATLAVRDLIGSSRELLGRMAQVTGRNATDMAAIDVLRQHGPMGVGELAYRLGIRSASASVLADRLERAGHVERVRDPTDRRRVVLTDTAAARAAVLDAWLPSVREIDQVCRALADAERAVVLDFLGHVTAAIASSGRTGPTSIDEPERPSSSRAPTDQI